MDSEYLTTAEVAMRLRLKERSVYELVRTRRIPCSRVAGKWLFPRRLVDAWVLAGIEGEFRPETSVPAVVAGSHDPLLSWAVDASQCGLAVDAGGSFDGLRRLANGRAMLAALHLPDSADSRHNREAVRGLAGPPDLVLLRFVQRQQGLITAPGNPAGLRTIIDLARPGLRVVLRQADAGSRALLDRLLAEAGTDTRALNPLPDPARSEEALALAVLQGSADAGLGIEAVSRRFGLGFVALHAERLDLALSRRDAFEPPVQRLLRFLQAPEFVDRARKLGGYRLEGLGEVLYNR
jgi:putative molybdopterin biosynthesis protein